jgi:hypothetical protein
MTIVTQFSWDDIADPAFAPPARQAWRQAVAEIATKARTALPALNGRVDGAVKLVLAGDVELLPDGTAQVASSTDPLTNYLVNGTCPCRDFAQAPSHLCRHRLAAIFARRTQALLPATTLAHAEGSATKTTITPSPSPDTTCGTPAASNAIAAQAPAAPLPEAPASANCYVTLAGRQVQVTLRDTNETRLLARLEQLLQRFPVDTQSLVQTPTTPQPPLCQWHGKMKESTKAKGTWFCPAKMADGSYCKERWPSKTGGKP